MSTDLTLMGGSPFDAIRREDERGEYWSARDLMPLLGYTKWERFEDSIGRARVSMFSAGEHADRHASRLREHVPTSGNAPDRERSNYRLSRYGCYMVAMNGDVRKGEIAAAQQYFAAKTREAELRQHFEIPMSYAEALELAARQAREIDAATQRMAELEPSAEAWDHLVDTGTTLDVGAAAKKLREDGIPMGRTRLYAYMRTIGWEQTGETEQGAAKTRVTAKGLAELRKRLAARAGEAS